MHRYHHHSELHPHPGQAPHPTEGEGCGCHQRPHHERHVAPVLCGDHDRPPRRERCSCGCHDEPRPETRCTCGCHREPRPETRCTCGCHRGPHSDQRGVADGRPRHVGFRRRLFTREEKIARLLHYLDALYAEAEAVEERLSALGLDLEALDDDDVDDEDMGHEDVNDVAPEALDDDTGPGDAS
ncbi:MAG: hypothetical protein R6X16_12280 [Anaerolineae bacterium]